MKAQDEVNQATLFFFLHVCVHAHVYMCECVYVHGCVCVVGKVNSILFCSCVCRKASSCFM